MIKMPLISVIIPVYNEVNTIKQVLEKINSVNIDKEIIAVDDGSTDGTDKALRDLHYDALKIIHHSSNRGKGAAVLTGLTQAGGEYVIIQDADLEYNPDEYRLLLDYARQNGLTAVFGSRFSGGRNARFSAQYFANKLITFLVNFLFGSSLTDAETCYKLVKTEVLQNLGLRAKKFEIEPEITINLLKKGYPIKEAPISYMPRKQSEGKKINWIDGLYAVIYIIMRSLR